MSLGIFLFLLQWDLNLDDVMANISGLATVGGMLDRTKEGNVGEVIPGPHGSGRIPLPPGKELFIPLNGTTTTWAIAALWTYITCQPSMNMFAKCRRAVPMQLQMYP